MQFSRLNDTAFPDSHNADPYAIRNLFDYTRWVPGTVVRLVNVLWNSDYENVVKFDSNKERDEWFDAIDGYEPITLKTNSTMVPDGSIKLPIPYDVCAGYNYIYMELPAMTSEDSMIDYESSDGHRRWYFFITGITYSAPNTTVVMLSSDIWTNYINETDVRYMMLERGHAPVAATDADKYLANPIANNRLLMAPDVNYDDSSVIKSSKYVPFGNGTKYICMASTIAPEQMNDSYIGSVAATGDASNITYSDTPDWYGRQLQVNGFSLADGRDYSGLRTPVMTGIGNGNIPCGTVTYAIPASDSAFMADIAAKAPTMLRSVIAMFICDEAMINLGAMHTVAGHAIYECAGVHKEVASIPLEKSMFGFDEEEQRFAKLYTYPYSRIEITDNDGKTTDIRIEDTGKIGMQLLTSVAFPALDMRVCLTGIDGVGSEHYAWKKLDGTAIDMQVPDGDWGRYTIKLGIPTFSLYMDGETAWYMDSYGTSLLGARRHALAGYRNSVRSSNLNARNANESAANAHANSVRDAASARDNSKALADTSQSNTNASAASEQTNAINSANTGKANTDNMNSCNYNNVNATIAANTANVDVANTASARLTDFQNRSEYDILQLRNAVTSATTDEDNKSAVACAETSGMATLASSTISTATSMGTSMASMGAGGAALGAVSGALIGVITGGMQASAAVSNSNTIAGAKSAIANANISANNLSQTKHSSSATTITVTENGVKSDQNTNSNNALATQRDNNYNTTAANAANLNATLTGNANRTHDTTVGNASRTHGTAYSNADRTYTASVSDADANLATSNTNAQRSNDIGILNAKETLEAAKDSVLYAASDARRSAPKELAKASGDATMESLMLNGVQFRIRTQPDGAIAQAASQFARYGYALEQSWDVHSTGFKLMKNFTYWKAQDVWVDVRGSGRSDVADAISAILRNGTTVWSNPEMIGKVSIYDN